MKQRHPEELDNARVAYQAAVDLWIYQAQQAWNRLAVLLTANSALIAAIAFTFSNNNPAPTIGLFRIICASLGFTLSLIWIALIKRGYVLMEYYTLAALEIEEKYFLPDISVIGSGRRLAAGEEIEFSLINEKKCLKMGQIATLPKKGALLYLTALAFAATFLAVIFWGSLELDGKTTRDKSPNMLTCPCKRV